MQEIHDKIHDQFMTNLCSAAGYIYFFEHELPGINHEFDHKLLDHNCLQKFMNKFVDNS